MKSLKSLTLAGALLLAAMSPLGAQPQAPVMSPASLVAASGLALHSAALAHVHGVELDGKLDVLGIAGTASQWQSFDSGAFATSQVAGPVSGDNGYDGRAVWNRDPFGVVWDDGSREGTFGAIDAAYVGSYALWKPNFGGATVVSAPSQTIAGVAYDVLTVTPPGSLPFDFLFDAATHLPYRTIAPIGIITTTTTFTDYAPFDGLQIAKTQKQETLQGASVFTVTSVRFDDARLASELVRPKSTVRDFSIASGTEATVPIELVDNHVYLDVSIDGKGPFRFVFDTGGSLVIDTAVAKQLGLNRAGSLQGIGVGASTDTFNFAQIDSLSIGGARVGRLNASIAPVRAGFAIAGGKPADGLIGFETLARFVTTFDYPNRRVTFRMPGAHVATAGGTTIPFVFNGTDPMIPCRIASAAGACTVDTGSRSSLSLYTPFAKAHSGLVSGLTAPGIDGFGVGGPEFGSLGRTSLSIGGYDVANIIADVSAQDKGAFAAPYVAGNIGGPVWRRFAVTFDYPDETMTLVPGADFASAEEFDRSGLFLVAMHDAIVAADVRAGTPAAAAGITRGEAIVSIDGKSASGMSLKDVRELFMQAPGTTYALVVAGKGSAPRPVTLQLANYV